MKLSCSSPSTTSSYTDFSVVRRFLSGKSLLIILGLRQLCLEHSISQLHIEFTQLTNSILKTIRNLVILVLFNLKDPFGFVEHGVAKTRRLAGRTVAEQMTTRSGPTPLKQTAKLSLTWFPSSSPASPGR